MAVRACMEMVGARAEFSIVISAAVVNRQRRSRLPTRHGRPALL